MVFIISTPFDGMSEYPIVPGLANLHNRLGFNNSHFLVHAMLEVITGRGHSAHVLNGLVAALSLPIVAQGFAWVFRGTANERQVGWFMLGLAMIVATAAVDGRIYSATPDFPATVFVTIAAWRLLVFSAFEEESRDKRLRWNLLAIGTLAAAAVSMKIFAAFFAGLAGIALVAVLYRMNRLRSDRPLATTARSLAFTAICSLLLFVPWAGRGYILSGYPLFPSTIAGAPVDWKYNAEAAANLQRTVRLWSRTYHMNYETGYDGWGWIPEWIVQVAVLRAPVETVIPAAIALGALVILAWSAFRSRPEQDTTEPSASSPAPGTTAFLNLTAWALAAAYFGTVVLWFVAAPSPRFGSYALWGLAAALLGLLSRTALGQWLTRHPNLLIAALATLLLLPMLDEAARIELRHRHKPDHFAYGKRIYHFYPFVLLTSDDFPPVPKSNLITRTTDSGLAVHLAARQPDGVPGLLWDSPLPAARFFKPGLALRRPGDIRGGFKINPSANPQDESTHDR